MSEAQFTVSVVRLPVPIHPLGEGPNRTLKITPPASLSTAQRALEHARGLVNSGYGVAISGPNGLRWDHSRVIRELNSGL